MTTPRCTRVSLALAVLLLVACADSRAPASDAGIDLNFTDIGPGRDASGLLTDRCETEADCRYGDCGPDRIDDLYRCALFSRCDHERNLGCPSEAVCIPVRVSPPESGFCGRICEIGRPETCPPELDCVSSGLYPERASCTRRPDL